MISLSRTLQLPLHQLPGQPSTSFIMPTLLPTERSLVFELLSLKSREIEELNTFAALASEGNVTFGVTLCVCVCCISLGGEGNVPYPMLSSLVCDNDNSVSIAVLRSRWHGGVVKASG